MTNGTFERYPNMEGPFNEDVAMERNAGLMSVGGGLYKQSIRKKYEAEIERFEKEIAKRREMLKLLDENPVIERFIDLQRS